MSVQDLWYSTRTKDPNGKPAKTSRCGNGLRYRVSYFNSDTGRRETMHFADKCKAQADAFDRKMKTALTEGRFIDPRSGDVSLRAYAERWLNGKTLRERSVLNIRTALEFRVYPYLGAASPMKTITTQRLRVYVKQLSETYAANTVHGTVQHLRELLKYAVHEGVLAKDPWHQIPLPKIRDIEVPRPDAVNAFIDACPMPHRAALLLAAGCGLRNGEISGLEPNNIDWDAGVATVRQQLSYVPGAPGFIAEPKTPSSYRQVAIPSVVMAALRELTPHTVTMVDKTDLHEVTREVHLLFASSTGVAMTAGIWCKLFEKVRAVPGVSQDITLHILRHYFATRLILNGASVKDVQMAMGHSKPSITLDTYTGWWPEHGVNTATIMDSLLTETPFAAAA